MINIIKNILLFIFCHLWKYVSGETISVSNEKELKESLDHTNNNTISELYININDVNIDIFNTINVESSLEKLYIIGSSKEKSILNFNNINHGLIFKNLFNDEFQEFKFINLTINGHLEIKKGININFDNVNLNGSLDFDKLYTFSWETVEWEEFMLFWDNYIDRFINLNYFTFYAMSEERENCINLYGNVNINNSDFNGNPSCRNSVVNIDGQSFANSDISNSHFDGVYANSCVSITDTLYSTVTNSTFEKGFSNSDGG